MGEVTGILNALVSCLDVRAQIAARTGHVKEALADTERALPLLSDTQARIGDTARGILLARLGRYSEASACVHRHVKETNSIALYNIACLLARCAEHPHPWTREVSIAAAIGFLRRAATAGGVDTARVRADDDFELIRHRPEFKSLLATIEAKALKKP